eukprot:SAG31_NODE_1570_length_7854_cov_2.292328_5_plen_70_part_00
MIKANCVSRAPSSKRLSRQALHVVYDVDFMRAKIETIACRSDPKELHSRSKLTSAEHFRGAVMVRRVTQ